MELLWEHSEAYQKIGTGGDPRFAEYAGEWPGRPTAAEHAHS